MVLPVSTKYIWKIRNPIKGKANTAKRIEQIIIKMEELTEPPDLFSKNIPKLPIYIIKVRTMLPKKQTKNL